MSAAFVTSGEKPHFELYSDLCGPVLVTFELEKPSWVLLLPLCPSLSLTHEPAHTSSHAFPCSGPGLVSPYFLSWLQAVSFFRSCIYPLGTLTSFEQCFINSISNSVPRKICFHCTGKTLFHSAVVWFHLTLSISKEKLSLEYHPMLQFCLISSQGIILVS